MASLTALELTPGRLWIWGIRSCISLIDQALTSGSSFFLNVLLARWLAKEAYGAFGVCFAGFLFLAGFHNVLFIEPMTVIGPSCYPQRLPDYFAAQLKAHMMLVGALSAVGILVAVALGLAHLQSAVVAVTLAGGVSIPFILLLWLTRRMCYVVQAPLIAAQGSGAYSIVLIAGTFELRRLEWLTPSTAFLWMAFASFFVSLFILRRLGVFATFRSTGKSLGLQQLLKENWGYGRWLTLTTALSWISVQVQTFLAASLLGLAAAGALRAMQLPSLALTQVIAATTVLVLPSMSQELGRGNMVRLRQKAVLTSIFLASVGIVFVAGLFGFAEPIEKLLFGEKYLVWTWLIPVLGLVPIFTGVASSLSLALRALRRSQFELLAYVASASVALFVGLCLMPGWGLTGAAASIVLSTAVLAIAVVVCFLKWGTVEASFVAVHTKCEVYESE